jgi:hypothetical protein
MVGFNGCPINLSGENRQVSHENHYPENFFIKEQKAFGVIWSFPLAE